MCECVCECVCVCVCVCTGVHMPSQVCGGQRQLFVGNQGMCLITKQGDEWIYKTAWSKHEFDEESEKIMEVLKNVGL